MAVVQKTISSSLTRRERKNFLHHALEISRNKRIEWVFILFFIALMLFIRPPPANFEASYRSSTITFDSFQGSGPPLFHFIHTTDESSFHRRSMRAIESVFYHHRDARVIVHIPQDGDTIGLHSDLTNKPFLRLQNAGYNVTVQPFQLKTLVDAAISQSNSIVDSRRAENWMKTKILPNVLGKSWYMDISDLVRLLVLYTQGGMYMDTDVIVTRPVDKLQNVIGFERPDGPASAILKFEKGNTFLGECINEYFAKYVSSTYAWGYVGPKLFKRVYKRKYPHCQLPDPPPRNDPKLGKVDPSCPVVVLWKEAFSPDVENCFVHTPNTQSKRQLIADNSFTAHIYNQKTKEVVEKMGVAKLRNEESLCNWLYNSFCIFCEDNVWEQ